MLTFDKINSELRKVILGVDRMPATRLSEAYSINNEDSSDAGVILVSDKGHKVTTSYAGLAACRLTDAADKVKDIKSTRDARANSNVWNLKTATESEGAKKLVVDGDMKITCVHKVDIWDTANNRPVYRNEDYKGYGDYRAACDDINITNPQSEDKELQKARGALFTAATTKLHKTEVISGAVAQQMPIFVVSK
jgi:hypothetical protein